MSGMAPPARLFDQETREEADMRKMTSGQIHNMIHGRDVTFHLTGAFELRLAALWGRLLWEDPEGAPADEDWDDTLDILIVAMLDRGLAESERDHGLQATPYGELFSRKLPLRLRLKLAWRELRA